jgi:DNA-binding GntR family transcriptional regulator
MSKGIRVNQLAKELDVESRDILNWLRAEGLVDKAPNHMSVLSKRDADNVRDAFAAGLAVTLDPGSATAEELAELLAEISTLYRLVGGSGVDFTVTEVREGVAEPR